MSESLTAPTNAPLAAQATTPTAPPAFGASNILGHISSTWTAVGLVLAAIAPLVNAQTMPTNGAGWVLFTATAAMAIVKALGR